MGVQVSCLTGYRIISVGKVSALMSGILQAPVGGHLPIQGSQLGLLPWPFLSKRGKAAGSLDIKHIWVIQQGVGGGQPEQMRNRWRPFPLCWLTNTAKGKKGFVRNSILGTKEL